MTITLTAKELQDMGWWEKVCEVRNIHPTFLTDNLMEGTAEFTFTEQEINNIFGFSVLLEP